MTKDEIKAEIIKHFGLNVFSNFSGYYVGITNDINRRLFLEHNVSEGNDYWIWCQAESKETAQKVEQYFLDLGMDGDTGGGTNDTLYVYCYKKTITSKE